MSTESGGDHRFVGVCRGGEKRALFLSKGVQGIMSDAMGESHLTAVEMLGSF